MPLYRARPEDGIAWITGASTGIGRDVALKLAARGWHVVATARSTDKLATLEAEATALPGTITPAACDVTDEASMQALAAALEDAHGRIALALFVAGNYWPVRGENPDPDNFRKTYEINLFGVLNGLLPAARAMRAHGGGHIGIVGSVSSYGGLPLASAYGGSKAAVNYLAQSLKFDFDKMNIRLQVFNPGFVDTPLTEQNRFPMPFLMTADDAAQRVVSGLDSGGFEVAFPRRFALLLKAVNLLPWSLYFPVMSRAMGWNKRPLRD
ncbi:oxidoreductase [Zhengella mangrovi]|uniref:Oxidoreductase n=1 Tax=Zhengella mangrovi TaxID=1982044 RepID=A0A2G1QR97_9HYPH|nr:SDR family NAD(P)-dependent oxidoreductase [Zhengella mangrovi]PHP68022.1 oxidoreductase [Zhengella mangrovi]